MAQGFLARVNGRLQQIFAIVVSSGAANSGDIAALGADGRFDETVMPLGIGANIVVAEASEAISAGRFVNLFYDTGVLKMRLADNSNARPAWGYVRDSVASAVDGSVYRINTTNANMSALTPGADYWLGVAGGVIDTPLNAETDTGKLDQYLGVASSATELVTVEHSPVYL